MKTTSYKLGGYKIIESDDRYFIYGDATKEGAAVGYQKLDTLFVLKTIS